MAEKSQRQWEEKATVKLTKCRADQIWSLYLDFCSLHKWMPILDNCEHVKGSSDSPQPGCIRICSGPAIDSHDGTVNPPTRAYEKLLSVDHLNRCLSYEVTENTMGFNNYVATINVYPGEDDNQKGCVVEWSYVTDPIAGWKYEDLFSVISLGLDAITKRMEAATLVE